MPATYLLLVTAGTSAAAWLFGRRALHLDGAALPKAVSTALECLGAAVLFWVANVALGAACALGARALGLGFVSLYVSTDLSVGFLALAQGLVFEAWRRAGRQKRT
jgi:hypothetical protein